MNNPIPLTLLTGFLGAGKTTLLKRILSESHGLRILVVQSEFSEAMGIETVGLRQPDGSLAKDVLEVPNGCMCCSIRDNVVASIERLVKERENYFTHVVVECSGVADPTSLIEAYWLDDQLISSVYLDAVICLVDTSTFLYFLQGNDVTGKNAHALAGKEEESLDIARTLSEIAIKQIIAANKILLNKVDLADENTTSKVSNVIQELNPFAQLEKCGLNANISLMVIFGQKCFDKAKLNTINDMEKISSVVDRVKEIKPYGNGGHRSGNLQNVLVTITEFERLPSRVEIDRTIGKIIWEKQCYGNVLRCKGVCKTIDGIALALQGVGDIFETTEIPESNFVCRFLFIGWSLDSSIIESDIHKLFK